MQDSQPATLSARLLIQKACASGFGPMWGPREFGNYNMQQDAFEFLWHLRELLKQSSWEGVSFENSTWEQFQTHVCTPLFGAMSWECSGVLTCQHCNSSEPIISESDTWELSLKYSEHDEPSRRCGIDHLLENLFADDVTVDTYTCNNCGARRMAYSRYHSVSTVPNILVIRLPRHDVTGRKLFGEIHFQPELNMTPFFKVSAKYTLVEAIHHIGSDWTSGHYVAVCNKALTETIWTEFDDERVYECDQNSALHPVRAYVLFYVRIRL